MAVLKCKMCGGNLLVDTDIQYAQCESCSTLQTVPYVQDEELQNMNHIFFFSTEYGQSYAGCRNQIGIL